MQLIFRVLDKVRFIRRCRPLTLYQVSSTVKRAKEDRIPKKLLHITVNNNDVVLMTLKLADVAIYIYIYIPSRMVHMVIETVEKFDLVRNFLPESEKT